MQENNRSQVWIRSLLFAPGNQQRKLQRVFDFGPDAVDLDLEDAVPVAEKSVAREMVRATLLKRGNDDASPLIIVRVNGPGTGLAEADLEAAVQRNVFAIHLTKLGSLDQVTRLDEMITQLEEERNIPLRSIKLICSVDSANLALNLQALAKSSSRLYCWILGGVDFAQDLGVSLSEDMTESLWVRSYGVLVSRDAGLAAPLHPPVIDLNDDERLLRVLERGKKLGFQGAVAVHPKQIPLIHRVFSPGAEEVRWAEKIVQQFHQSETEGKAALRVDGHFVDYAVVKTAQRILSRRDAR